MSGVIGLRAGRTITPITVPMMLPIVAAATLGAILLVFRRYYDPDEFEHIQASWQILDGMVPYRDFFEHHTPIYHLLNAAVIGLLTGIGASPVAIVVGLRLESVALSIVMLVLTFRLARLICDRQVAALSVLLVASCSIFLVKGIEIRPDQLGAVALLGACISLVHGGPDKPTSRLSLFVCGILCAIAVMTTQKNLFALPGLALQILARKPTGVRPPVLDLLLVAVGGIVGSLPILAYCLHNDMLMTFIQINLLGNATWPRNIWVAARVVLHSLTADTVFFALFVAGLTLIRRNWSTDPEIERLGVIVRPLTSMLIGLFVIPIAQFQYFFLFLPFAAIIAAWAAIRWLAPRLDARLASLLAAAVPAVFITAHIATAWAMPDPYALDKLRYITTETNKDATFMSGWSPGLAFRRPATYFPFLYNEVRYITPAPVFARMVDDLRSGKVKPEVIDFDDDTKAVPGLAAFVQEAYEPTGVGTLWRRKPL